MSTVDNLLGIATVGLAAGVAMKVTDMAFTSKKPKHKKKKTGKHYIPGIS